MNTRIGSATGENTAIQQNPDTAINTHQFYIRPTFECAAPCGVIEEQHKNSW